VAAHTLTSRDFTSSLPMPLFPLGLQGFEPRREAGSTGFGSRLALVAGHESHLAVVPTAQW
jgi:hypothetical protein